MASTGKKLTRKRKSPSSRNGCITCKFRHVKCGEEKPACTQCTSTGRKCDGYESLSQKQLRQRLGSAYPHRTLSPDTRLVMLPGTREERESIHLFCTQTVQALSGCFSNELWLYHLPQLSQSNQAIRHTAVAVSAAHRARMQPGRDDRFELEQANKAIQTLLSKSQTTPDIMLIACSLFVCLGILKEDPKQVWQHVEAGLRILCRQGQPTSASKAPTTIDRELSAFFGRMNLQLGLFGRPMFPHDPVDEEYVVDGGKLAFASIGHARNALTRLMTLVREFFGQVRIAGALYDYQREAFAPEQRKLLLYFEAWRAAFERMKEIVARRKSMKVDRQALLILEVHYRTMSTWTACYLSPDEMVYDRYNSVFDDIVRAAEEAMGLSAGDTRPTFNIESNIGPALYLIARKCRHPLARRRVLEVLKHYPEQDGLWNIRQAYRTALRIMELEEKRASHLPVEKRVPEGADRICETILMDTNFRETWFPVMFVMKPKPGCEIETRTEILHISPPFPGHDRVRAQGQQSYVDRLPVFAKQSL